MSAKAASLSQADVSATSEAAPTAQSDGANPTEVASSGHADVVTAKAASKRKQAVSELEKPAGEELQQKANAIPPRTEKSNAAAAASVQAAPAAPSEPAVKAAKGTARKVPASTKTATTVAKQTRTRTKSAKKLAPASKQIDQTTIDQTMSGNAAEQDKSAGKELQQSVHSIPPSTEDSNAAAEGGDLPQTAAVAKQARKLTRSPRISARATKQLDQIASRSAVKKDKSAGKELQQSVNSISPPATDSDTAAEEVKLSQSVTAAKQARKRTASRKMSVPASEQLDQSASGSPAKQNKPAGKELQQSVDSIPPSTEDSNAAAEGVNPLQSVTVAKQARKRTKSTKKSASPSKQADQTALGSAAEQDESAGNLKECSKA